MVKKYPDIDILHLLFGDEGTKLPTSINEKDAAYSVNLRKQRISLFMDTFFNGATEEEQGWLEMQLKFNLPPYRAFLEKDVNKPLYDMMDKIESSVRPLCIDAIYVGCCIVQQGHQKAGEKLIKTALKTALLDPDLVKPILADIEASFDALSAHSELKSLRKSDG